MCLTWACVRTYPRHKTDVSERLDRLEDYWFAHIRVYCKSLCIFREGEGEKGPRERGRARKVGVTRAEDTTSGHQRKTAGAMFLP